jgi:hypothetical protein
MKNLKEYTKRLHFNVQTFTMEFVASGAQQTWHLFNEKKSICMRTHFPFNDNGDGESNITEKIR